MPKIRKNSETAKEKQRRKEMSARAKVIPKTHHAQNVEEQRKKDCRTQVRGSGVEKKKVERKAEQKQEAKRSPSQGAPDRTEAFRRARESLS